jgi:hypothetical protein
LATAVGHLAVYAGLFAAALAAATVLPAQSGVALVALLLAEHYPAWLLVLVASIGNTLGSTVNWGLGRLLARFEHRCWFPIRRQTIAHDPLELDLGRAQIVPGGGAERWAPPPDPGVPQRARAGRPGPPPRRARPARAAKMVQERRAIRTSTTRMCPATYRIRR